MSLKFLVKSQFPMAMAVNRTFRARADNGRTLFLANQGKMGGRERVKINGPLAYHMLKTQRILINGEPDIENENYPDNPSLPVNREMGQRRKPYHILHWDQV
ncbi:Uncharacterized protein TCM_026023 [Theobroma cacao]|uniref:Uncharacterized protein n=1 Tax=Theobroma cacao TaxID=3641 RepID=A0A061F111_THECC|nr:Uncharacterized protein TCM_026023 [Theobroma cacao]